MSLGERRLIELAYPNLSAEMKRFGIEQREMASSIGRTPQTVSNWMSGRNSPTVEDAFKVRDTFFPNMSIDYLFADDPIS